jgi:hypothetical protein
VREAACGSRRRLTSGQGGRHFIPGRSNGVEADTQGPISVIDRLQGFDILAFDGSP